ncbi:MAG: efflux RND transporter periplasmic adaptor subunit [candidate division Zixibacteria bacterium]|nr:efflux RND transporter periplasmic adaptor subunit [candidate division Zixibacteria bacterium]
MSDSDMPYDLYEHEPLPEGEEAPPRYVHTMAIVRWIILGGLTIFALIMVFGYFGLAPGASSGAKEIMYHCPMHPTYVSNQPGECPICGMNLVPIDKNGTAATQESDSVHAEHEMAEMAKAKPGQYTCPMDPEVISDVPGECPKCGMDLVKVEETQPAQKDENMGEMPGMEETPKVAPESGQMGDMGSAPVPGLVPVTIEPERLQLIGIKTAIVARRPLGGGKRIAGYITPDESKVANIHVRVSGWISKLYVDQTGQLIKKGEPLFSLYSQDLFAAEQDYFLAREAASKAGTDSTLVYMRQQLLAASRERLSLLGLSEQELQQLDKETSPGKELTIRSPFSGYVLDKSVNAGQYVTPDQNLFTIADLSSVWVIGEVYEQDLQAIQTGQTVQMHPNSQPGELFNGEISFVYPTVSEKTRTVRVRMEFANPGMRLRPGMYAEVDISGTDNEVLAVPSEAVVNSGENQYAFVVHDKKHFEPRLLKIGQTSDDWVEVLSGLSEGEEIVTSANFLIDAESRLKAALSGMGGKQAGSHSGHTQ